MEPKEERSLDPRNSGPARATENPISTKRKVHCPTHAYNPALRRLRQKDCEFEAGQELHSKFKVSLDYVTRPVSNKQPE